MISSGPLWFFLRVSGHCHFCSLFSKLGGDLVIERTLSVSVAGVHSRESIVKKIPTVVAGEITYSNTTVYLVTLTL